MGRWCKRVPLEVSQSSSSPNRDLTLLVHRLHNGTYDSGKDRTAARAANRIAEKAAQCPASSRIGTCGTSEESTKKSVPHETAGHQREKLDPDLA